jgi:ankyrin repeat protein
MMCESFPTAEARTRGALQSSVQPQQPQQRSSTAQNDHRPAIASHSCPTPTPMPTNFLEIDSSTDQKLFGNAPLHRATRGGHIGIVQLLTEQGAYLEAVNDCGQTALHIAAECGHASIVRLLLEKGLYVNLRDLSGLTALHLAAAEGHEEVVMLLLGAGVDID